MSDRRGADAVVEYLEALGVPYLFLGPVGHTQLELLTATRDSDVEPVMTKHELVAGYMACGYASVTHEPAVVSTHTSPGLGNAFNQYIVASLNSLPVVDLHTDTPVAWRGRHGHHSLEWGSGWGSPYRPAETVTKGTWDVSRVETLREALPATFRTTLTGRPGPTLLNLPMDVLAAETAVEAPTTRRIVRGRPGPDADAVEAAADLLVEADRPVLLCGGGTVIGGAEVAVERFTAALALPVVTTDSGKGVFAEDHPLHCGVVGNAGMRSANEVVGEADLVLAVGTRFPEFVTAAWTHGKPFRFPDQRLIHVDIDAAEFGRNYPVDVGVVGDAGPTLDAIRETVTERVAPADFERPDHRSRARQAVESWEDDVADYYELTEPLTMGAVIRAVRRAMPRDAIVTADSGRNRGEVVSAWEAFTPRSVVMDTGNGAMGYATCAALGAKLAAPDREVVAITGDGGFVIVNQALATAVEYDIPVTWVVLNDRGFSSLTAVQEAYFGGEYRTQFVDSVGDPYDMDFVGMAASFGVDAVRVETPDELRAGIERAVGEDRPFLLDVVVSREGAGVDVGAPWVQAGRGESRRG